MNTLMKRCVRMEADKPLGTRGCELVGHLGRSAQGEPN